MGWRESGPRREIFDKSSREIFGENTMIRDEFQRLSPSPLMLEDYPVNAAKKSWATLTSGFGVFSVWINIVLLVTGDGPFTAF